MIGFSLYFVCLHHLPIKDATITLEIEYVPPGDTTADVKVSQKQEETRETPEGKRDDDHEDYRDEYESDNGDDASRKGKEKQSRVPEKKRIRRRLRRKWSDKIKDFQVIKDISCDNEACSREAFKWSISAKKKNPKQLIEKSCVEFEFDTSIKPMK